jgi:hypothetical protein
MRGLAREGLGVALTAFCVGSTIQVPIPARFAWQGSSKVRGAPLIPHSLMADPPLQIRAHLPQWRLRKDRRLTGENVITQGCFGHRQLVLCVGAETSCSCPTIFPQEQDLQQAREQD